MDKLNIKTKKILFIYPDNERESLGIEYLSASLKKRGHKTSLILFNKMQGFEEEFKKTLEYFNPDFICFSVVTNDYLWACEIGRRIKQIKDIPIIFGGIHPTSCPEEVINSKFVDYVVLGEGEDSLIELIENPKKSNIKNVWMKKNNKIIKNPLRPLIQELDSLPFPDKEIFYKKLPYLKNYYWCLTSRGCPFSCSYCFNNYLKKLYSGQKWLRRRSVKNVIEELKFMKEKWNYKGVIFVDDCFTSDKKWLEEFIKEYKKEINIDFSVISIAKFIDEKVARLLKYGGCIEIQIGVQTPIEKIRREICKRYDTNQEIEKAVKEAKKQKMLVALDHIFELPSQMPGDYDAGLEFYINLKPTSFNLFKLVYYPNTEIIEIGKKYKIIDDEIEKDSIKGKVISPGVSYDTKKENFENLFRFMLWIPILPKNLSKFLLRTKLYSKIPKNKYINKIPLIVPNFYNLKVMKHFFETQKTRILRKFAI